LRCRCAYVFSSRLTSVITKSKATKQSILSAWPDGLLPPSLVELRRTSRFARNDGGGCGRPQSSNIGGGLKPPNSRSISSASFSGVRSSSQGPTICAPTGNPSGEKPVGIAVEGKPGNVAIPGQAS